MSQQEQRPGVIQISAYGTAPQWKAKGFTMLQVVHATVAELEENFDPSLVAVRGASIFGRDGYAEYAIFAQTDQRLRPESKIREICLGNWGHDPLGEQIADLRRVREKARSFFDRVEGMVVDEELAGRGGSSFLLMPDAHHDGAAIDRAASRLRASRDIIAMQYVRLEPFSAPVPA